MILWRDGLSDLAGNDNVLEALGLYTLDEDGNPIFLVPPCTIQVTLLDEMNTPLPGETWPVDFTYRTGTHGDWQAVLRDTVEVGTKTRLKAHMVIDNGSDQRGSVVRPVWVQTREH